MKITLLIIALTLTLSNLGFSQNALYLKNGDKMSGKLEGFKNDTILFNFQGNQLKFKTADIISVFFNEKEVSTEPAKAVIPIEINPSKMGKVSGVVTYLARFEFEPDVDSEIYFADSTNLKDFNYATLDSFYNAMVYKTFRKTWTARPANQLIANIYDEGEKYNLDKESFNLLDKRTAINISKILEDKSITKAVVDGSGNYSIKVKPGTYYVLLKSRNTPRLSKLATSELFKCNKLTISEGEDITMSYAFGFEYK